MKKTKLAVGLLTAAAMTAGMASTAMAAGNLTFGCQMYSDGMIDPIAQTNCAWNAMRYGINECLFKFNDSMEPQPWLAESAETEDNITWVVKLKEGVKFSDGCDMTATKVKESFDRAMAEGPNGSSSPDKFLEYGTEIIADDEANTVTFVLPNANFNFTGNMCYPVMAVTDVADTTD